MPFQWLSKRTVLSLWIEFLLIVTNRTSSTNYYSSARRYAMTLFRLGLNTYRDCIHTVTAYKPLFYTYRHWKHTVTSQLPSLYSCCDWYLAKLYTYHCFIHTITSYILGLYMYLDCICTVNFYLPYILTFREFIHAITSYIPWDHTACGFIHEVI